MRRYFITGGTGFIGRELVRQILARDDTEFVVCLTRGHRKKMLRREKLGYWTGDITECAFPAKPEPHWQFTDVIHGANEVNDLLQPDQHRYYYTIVEGTNRILKWCASNKTRTLILSSGAVARDTVYGRAKRQCELIARSYANYDYGLNRIIKIARIFSVIGPEMPLNGQYAAGKFVHMARNGCVNVWGGTSVRSYLDVTDCAAWLLRILDVGESLKPYDVAGLNSTTVLDLAQRVADVFGVPLKHIRESPREDIYLPDLRDTLALGCEQKIHLTQSLERIRDYFKAPPDVRSADVDAPERA